jgi:hypothetical protein
MPIPTNPTRIALAGLVLALAAASCGPPAPKAIAPADVPHAVGLALIDWRLFGLAPDKQPDGTTMHDTFAEAIEGVHGTIQGGGPFQGDTEWYEFDLSDGFELELRSRLEGSNAVDKLDTFPLTHRAPAWWPQEWPPHTRFYCQGNSVLVLLEAGTHAWLVRTRS